MATYSKHSQQPSISVEQVPYSVDASWWT